MQTHPLMQNAPFLMECIKELGFFSTSRECLLQQSRSLGVMFRGEGTNFHGSWTVDYFADRCKRSILRATGFASRPFFHVSFILIYIFVDGDKKNRLSIIK